MLLSRLASIVLFIWLSKFPLEIISSGNFRGGIFTILFVITMFIALPAYLMWTLFGTIWIRYNEQNGNIHFYHFFKVQKILPKDIDGYYKTMVKSYAGYVLKLKDGNTIEVSEYNVKPLQDFELFLTKNKISYYGNTASRFPFKVKL